MWEFLFSFSIRGGLITTLLKLMTLLNTETSVSIFVENFLAAILDIQNGCHQTAIFVHYSATK